MSQSIFPSFPTQTHHLRGKVEGVACMLACDRQVHRGVVSASPESFKQIRRTSPGVSMHVRTNKSSLCGTANLSLKTNIPAEYKLSVDKLWKLISHERRRGNETGVGNMCCVLIGFFPFRLWMELRRWCLTHDHKKKKKENNQKTNQKVYNLVLPVSSFGNKTPAGWRWDVHQIPRLSKSSTISHFIFTFKSTKSHLLVRFMNFFLNGKRLDFTKQ